PAGRNRPREQDRGSGPSFRTRALRSGEKGQRMADSPSATALTPHPFDEEAFKEFAALADEADMAFDLNAIDRGFDRLIEQPKRATSGKTLAGRLARDGRKYLKAKRRREVLSDCIEADDPHAEAPTDLELADIRWAVGVIRNGLMGLAPRDRQVLATKA